MGCCVGGCLRLLLFAFWRALFAALLAIVFTRIDDYLGRSGLADTRVGKVWRLYRSRGRKRTPTAPPPREGPAIHDEGRPRP